MSKKKTQYICQSCGHAHPKWQGRCDGCGEWNTLVEEIIETPKKRFASTVSAVPVSLSKADKTAVERIPTGFGEFDRVLGGGIVPGSAVLLSGEPGIGKSTMLLQVAIRLANAGKKILFVTGEESVGQIKLRADRLGPSGGEDSIFLLAETCSEAAVAEAGDYDAIVVDSIQAMASADLQGAAGNVSQVRQSAAIFIELAKRSHIPVFLVGHVTKSGAIAGPKVLEHAVDVVLTLEGDSQSELRLLRSTKNRFGATGEIGVFSMGENGFSEVENPSAAFLGHHDAPVPGSTVFAGIEGNRPLFVEIQALASPAAYGTPQRVAQGLDPRRLIMLAAILERRGGLPLSRQDLFINVVGGVNLTERSADLAVVLSIVGSFRDKPISDDIAVFGEIGLTGELRRAPRTPPRVKEAARLGFSKVIIPEAGEKLPKIKDLEIIRAKDIFSAFKTAFRD